MHIRQATKEDVSSIYPLIYTIWNDMNFPLLEKLPNEQFRNIMLRTMCDKHAKFYYKNAYVCEIDSRIVGILYGYYGVKEPLYDKYFQTFLAKHLPPSLIPNMPDYRETNDKEWYIDALVVLPDHHNKGIGTGLINALHHFLPINTIIGLNCEVDNTNALRFYQRLGFSINSNLSFLGHTYRHLTKYI